VHEFYANLFSVMSVVLMVVGAATTLFACVLALLWMSDRIVFITYEDEDDDADPKRQA